MELVIRILIVDGRPEVRLGLRMRLGLEPDMRVVGEAGDAETSLALVRALHPDIVLMDVAMPPRDGVATVEAIRTLAPETAVVVLTLDDNAKTRSRTLAAGALGFVAKRGSGNDLLPEIRRVARHARS